MNLILIGYKTSGKTTLAKAYQKKFGCDFLDTDCLMIDLYFKSHKKKYSISQIYECLGEVKFRELETVALKSAKSATNSIIATGGGIIESNENKYYLKKLGLLIYLNVDKKILHKRINKLINKPNILNNTYLYKRDNIYKNIADTIININQESVEDLVNKLHKIWCMYGK